MLTINSRGKIGVFTFFVPLSLLFNSVGIFHSAFKSYTTLYMALIFLVLIVFSWLFNRTAYFSVAISNIVATPKALLTLLFVIYCLSISIYFYFTSDILLRGLPAPQEVYATRLEAISIDKYWMFVAITNIGLSLSVMYLILEEKLKWLLVTSTYILFFVISMQKSPIANLFLIQGFFYVLIHGLSVRFIVGATTLMLAFFYYMTIVTLGDADFGRIGLLLNALGERVFAAGYLVVKVYETVGSDVRFFGGATLPKLFGFIDINMTGRNVSLPAFIMGLTGQLGGANTSFFTEGFANFGYGGDFAFILFFYSYVACMLFLIRLLAPVLLPFFVLTTSIAMIHVVHSDIWGFFTSQIFIAIIFVLLAFIPRKSNGGNVQIMCN